MPMLRFVHPVACSLRSLLAPFDSEGFVIGGVMPGTLFGSTAQCLGDSLQTTLQLARRRPAIAETEVGIRHFEPVSRADVGTVIHQALVKHFGATRRGL